MFEEWKLWLAGVLVLLILIAIFYIPRHEARRIRNIRINSEKRE
jgi:hypothetical protein